MQLLKRPDYQVDEQIHAYTRDIAELMERIDSSTEVDVDVIDLLQNNLKVMILCQQRLLETQK